MELVELNEKAGVPRARDGRPRVFTPCEECKQSGRVPGARANTTKKCPACKGEGAKGVLYTRMTTFIDCLEDKSNLSNWKQRITAVGLSLSPELLDELRKIEDPMGEGRQEADKIVSKAEEAAGASLKATFGDVMHAIYEDINRGKDPGFVPEEFEADVAAYREVLRREGIIPVDFERFVVNDKYQAGGSFDILGLHYGFPLEERNGRRVMPRGVLPKLKIMDVKTGRIDYGRSKIAMQLGGYSESLIYDHVDYSRKPINYTLPGGKVLEVDQDEAIILHAPAGQGEVHAVPVDISRSRAGLELAWQVRQWRKEKFVEEATTSVTAADLCK